MVDRTGSRPVNLESSARFVLGPNQELLIVPSCTKLRVAAGFVAVHGAHQDSCTFAWGARHAARAKKVRRDEFCVLRQPHTASTANANGRSIRLQKDTVRPKPWNKFLWRHNVRVLDTLYMCRVGRLSEVRMWRIGATHPFSLRAEQRRGAPQLLGAPLGAPIPVAWQTPAVVVAAVDR